MTRRTPAISRSSPAACKTTARSATGSSTISTRPIPRAKKASLPDRFRWTTISPISMPGKRGTALRTCSSPHFPMSARPSCCRPRSGASTTSSGGIRSPTTTRPPIARASASIPCARWAGNSRRRGPTNRLVAVLGFPWLLLKERSAEKAMRGVDYLWTEQTRMLPAPAFEQIGASLVALVAQPPSAADAVRHARENAGVRSRCADLPSVSAIAIEPRGGDAPVATLREYRQRLPRDPSKVKTVPVPPRPFPRSLRDPDLLPPPTPASETIAAIWACLSVVGIPWVVRRLWRRWRVRVQPESV